MKILQLCKKFPFPLRDGESIANTYLSKSLQELGCEITLLAMNTRKHYLNIEDLPEDFDHYKEIFYVDIDNRLKAWDALKSLIRGESYHISRFVSKEFDETLIHLLKRNDYDVIQLETVYLAPYLKTIKKYSNAIIAMRAHNVEHEIWERIAGNSKPLPKKWYLNHLSEKLKSYEVRQLKYYDILITVTDRDLSKYRGMGYHNGAIVTPIGIRLKNYREIMGFQSKTLQSGGIGFIGALDWMPNQEGLLWFLDEVWPKYSKNWKLHVAGRNGDQMSMGRSESNVLFHGEVLDASDFVMDRNVMIVPLLSGSGMRVKILESMALGKLVITTKIGLEGIHATHKKNILIADTAEDFVKCLEYCYDHPQDIVRMGENARSFILENFNSKNLARKLYDRFHEVIMNPYPQPVS